MEPLNKQTPHKYQPVKFQVLLSYENEHIAL